MELELEWYKGDGTRRRCTGGDHRKSYLKKLKTKVEEEDEEDEEEYEEALDLKARAKRKQMMKAKGKAIAKKRARAMKKKASPEKLKKRAQKTARDIITNKILGGKSKSDLSFGTRQSLEIKVDKKKAVIKKIAKKLLPQIKKKEAERLKKMKEND
tara:strand:- start:2963 stop:3430 length:468 start_codon:yes stop_codon:yes gene_type:complete